MFIMEHDDVQTYMCERDQSWRMLVKVLGQGCDAVPGPRCQSRSASITTGKAPRQIGDSQGNNIAQWREIVRGTMAPNGPVADRLAVMTAFTASSHLIAIWFPSPAVEAH